MQNNGSTLTSVCTRVSGTCAKRARMSDARERRQEEARSGGESGRERERGTKAGVRRTIEAWILKIYRRQNKWMNLGRGYLSEIEIYRIFVHVHGGVFSNFRTGRRRFNAQ